MAGRGQFRDFVLGKLERAGFLELSYPTTAAQSLRTMRRRLRRRGKKTKPSRVPRPFGMASCTGTRVRCNRQSGIFIFFKCSAAF